MESAITNAYIGAGIVVVILLILAILAVSKKHE